MKEVVRISLAGVSFVIEKEGCIVLDAYLNEIGDHYNNGEEKGEILNDIEERIAEIFSERTAPDGVVSMETVNYAISLLGRPSEIFGEQQDSCGADRNASAGQTCRKDETPVKKRLFRDINNRIVAGVCSGMGAYFNVDAVWIRLVWVVLGIASCILESNWILHGGCGYLVIAYIILWIIVPAAKTVQQRYAMFGTQNAFDEIEKRVNGGASSSGRESVKSSSFARVFVSVMGALLILIALSLIVSVSFPIFCGVFALNISGMDMLSYLHVESSQWLLKALSLFVIYGAPLGMIYGGVMMLFHLKAPKWHPGLIFFIVWLIALIASVIMWINAFLYRADYVRDVVSSDLPSQYDTLYVRFQPTADPLAEPLAKAVIVERQEEEGCTTTRFINGYPSRLPLYEGRCSMVYVSRTDGKTSEGRGYIFEFYPNLVINAEEKSYSQIKCRFRRPILSNSSTLRELNNIYKVQDSLITVFPVTISKDEKYSGQYCSLELEVPQNVTVIMTDPEGKMISPERH